MNGDQDERPIRRPYERQERAAVTLVEGSAFGGAVPGQRVPDERPVLWVRAVGTASDLRDMVRQRLLEQAPQRSHPWLNATHSHDGFFAWEMRTVDEELGPVGVCGESIRAQMDTMTELLRAPAGWSATVWKVRLDPFGNGRYLYGSVVAHGRRPWQVDGVLWDAR